MPDDMRVYPLTRDSSWLDGSQAPLLSVPGVSLDILAIDLLHTWHLGGLGHFVGFAMWCLIRSGIWSRHIPGLLAADQYKISIIHLKTLMWAYYKRRRTTDARFKTTGSQVRTFLSFDWGQFQLTMAGKPAR